MDAAKILICKALGKKDSYRSVRNSQKKSWLPFIAVFREHIQLLHYGNDHWLLTFSLNAVFKCTLKHSWFRDAKICKCALSEVEEWGKLIASFLPVQRQDDGHICDCIGWSIYDRGGF